MARRKSNFWLWIAAGILAFLLGPILMPVWLSLETYYAYSSYVFFYTGIILILIAGALHLIRRFRSVKIILALLGFTWLVLFTYVAFPAFSISLL
ncbi:MAG: hypothetical protein ACTSRP_09045 [Candidatus Helarchaeota archaeon]